MNTIEAKQAMLELQLTATKALGPEFKAASETTIKSEFSDLLKQAVNQVNEFQHDANNLAVKFEQGDKSINLSQVMVAIQKANISLQAMTQVRNHLVNAYQEIMSMPI